MFLIRDMALDIYIPIGSSFISRPFQVFIQTFFLWGPMRNKRQVKKGGERRMEQESNLLLQPYFSALRTGDPKLDYLHEQTRTIGGKSKKLNRKNRERLICLRKEIQFRLKREIKASILKCEEDEVTDNGGLKRKSNECEGKQEFMDRKSKGKEEEDKSEGKETVKDRILLDYEVSFRAQIWRLLLGSLEMEILQERPLEIHRLLQVSSVAISFSSPCLDIYSSIVAGGPSSRNDKIQLDTCRTFRSDEKYMKKVSEESLIRVLNAYVRLNFDGMKANDAPRSIDIKKKSTASNLGGDYVQGLNIHAAIFLYTLGNEVDAFFALNSLLLDRLPGYTSPNLIAVHEACRLVDEVVKLIDPKLYTFLVKRSITCQIYGFKMLLSLFGCLKPLDEVILLWDSFLTFGCHLNVLSVAALIISMREHLMRHPSPIMLLQLDSIPPLKSNKLLKKTFEILKGVPFDLYKEIVLHCYIIS